MRNPLQVSRQNRTPVWGQTDFDDIFDRMFRNPFALFEDMRPATASLEPTWFKPGFDVEETEEAYRLAVDLPGLKKEDVAIHLDENVLTISGERKLERDEKTKGRYERAYGRFQQSFTLPSTIDVEKVEAKMEEGVLKIALPKSAQSKPRTITVS